MLPAQRRHVRLLSHLPRPGPPEVRGTAWIHEAVGYQVFVDRFARGDPRLNSPGVDPWGSLPTATGFMGGDLPGITGRLDHLQDLGINLLALSPIFMAASNHRYDTYDYHRIDPRLGTLDDFRGLVEEAHARGIRVMLDGVFNHCGRGFFPFFDVMENGPASAWRDWFYVDGFPVDAYGKPRYQAWSGVAALPELNLAHPATRDYLLGVAQFWTALGVDAWRIDAVPHARHRGFWRELAQAVRATNPEAYLLAEIWGNPQAWLAGGDFDGATNYPFRELVLRFLFRRSIRASELAGRLAGLLRRQPWPAPLGMCNLLGSHDTPRLGTVARGDECRLRLALLLLFTFPGIPALYYGDEIGMQGGKDPDNRRAMVWSTEGWDRGLHAYVCRLVRLRRTLPALQRGDWQTILTDDKLALCVFGRRHEGQQVLLALHTAERAVPVRLDLKALALPQGCRLVDLLTDLRFMPTGPEVEIVLPPLSGALLGVAA